MTDLVVRRSAVLTMVCVRNAEGCVALPWYSGGMKFNSRIRDLRTLPLYSNGAKDAQMLELERRREFVRSCVAARNRAEGKGQEIDPVLAFHLGLQKPQQ